VDLLKLSIGSKRLHHEEALVEIGRLLKSMGKYKQAMGQLKKTIGLRGSHHVYKGRYELGDLYANWGYVDPRRANKKEIIEGDLHEAVNVFRDLVWSELKDTSIVKRDARFALANIHYRLANLYLGDKKLKEKEFERTKKDPMKDHFKLARDAFSETAEKYKDDLTFLDEVQHAFYRTGYLFMRNEGASSNEEVRKEALNKAIKGFKAVADIADRRKNIPNLKKTKSKVPAYIEKNSLFFRAECYRNLKKWAEAIKLYGEVINKGQDHPLAMASLWRLSECYKKIRNSTKANEVLGRARDIYKEGLDRPGKISDEDFKRKLKLWLDMAEQDLAAIK